MGATILILVATIIPPIVYALYILICKYFGNQYFQKNLPTLPILEDQKPLIGHLHMWFSSRYWLIFQNYHKKVGKNFGYYTGQRRAISTIDLDLIKKFAVEEDHHDRSPRLTMAADEFEIGNLFTARGEEWRRIRKALAPALSKHKVMSVNVQDGINAVINKFMDSIQWRLDRAKREQGEDFIVEDVDEYLQRYTIALIFTCIYKKDDMVDFRAETDQWQSIADHGVRLMANKCTLIPQALPILNPIMKVIVTSHPYGKFIKKVIDFTKEQMELHKRASLESQGKNGELDEANFTMKDGTMFKGNMIDIFIGKYMNKSITQQDFYHTSFMLFLGGYKTSADALSRLIYLLACHQNVQEKLRESVILDGTESTYLTWVINEAMRLFPPVHIGCSRTTRHDIETKLGKIPGKTFMHTPLWTIHRWPEYWGDDADEFKPERWAKSETFHPMQFIPFGAGRRICPGKEFALREMRMLMVTLLPRYKFERCERTIDTFEFQTPFGALASFDDPTWIKISRL